MKYVLYWTIAWWSYKPCNQRMQEDSTIVYDLCRKVIFENHELKFSTKDSAMHLYKIAVADKVDSVNTKKDKPETRKIIKVRIDSSVVVGDSTIKK